MRETLQMQLFELGGQITSAPLSRHFSFVYVLPGQPVRTSIRGGAGDTALKPVTFCVSGSYIEVTCQRRPSSTN